MASTPSIVGPIDPSTLGHDPFGFFGPSRRPAPAKEPDTFLTKKEIERAIHALRNNQNYYQILGVENWAELDEIKRKIRQFLLTFHEDKLEKLSRLNSEEARTYAPYFAELLAIAIKARSIFFDKNTRGEYNAQLMQEASLPALTFRLPEHVLTPFELDPDILMAYLEERAPSSSLAAAGSGSSAGLAATESAPSTGLAAAGSGSPAGLAAAGSGSSAGLAAAGSGSSAGLAATESAPSAGLAAAGSEALERYVPPMTRTTPPETRRPEPMTCSVLATWEYPFQRHLERLRDRRLGDNAIRETLSELYISLLSKSPKEAFGRALTQALEEHYHQALTNALSRNNMDIDKVLFSLLKASVDERYGHVYANSKLVDYVLERIQRPLILPLPIEAFTMQGRLDSSAPVRHPEHSICIRTTRPTFYYSFYFPTDTPMYYNRAASEWQPFPFEFPAKKEYAFMFGQSRNKTPQNVINFYIDNRSDQDAFGNQGPIKISCFANSPLAKFFTRLDERCDGDRVIVGDLHTYLLFQRFSLPQDTLSSIREKFAQYQKLLNAEEDSRAASYFHRYNLGKYLRNVDQNRVYQLVLQHINDGTPLSPREDAYLRQQLPGLKECFHPTYQKEFKAAFIEERNIARGISADLLDIIRDNFGLNEPQLSDPIHALRFALQKCAHVKYAIKDIENIEQKITNLFESPHHEAHVIAPRIMLTWAETKLTWDFFRQEAGEKKPVYDFLEKCIDLLTKTFTKERISLLNYEDSAQYPVMLFNFLGEHPETAALLTTPDVLELITYLLSQKHDQPTNSLVALLTITGHLATHAETTGSLFTHLPLVDEINRRASLDLASTPLYEYMRVDPVTEAAVHSASALFFNMTAKAAAYLEDESVVKTGYIKKIADQFETHKRALLADSEKMAGLLMDDPMGRAGAGAGDGAAAGAGGGDALALYPAAETRYAAETTTAMVLRPQTALVIANQPQALALFNEHSQPFKKNLEAAVAQTKETVYLRRVTFQGKFGVGNSLLG